jgi:hypothetical protein
MLGVGVGQKAGESGEHKTEAASPSSETRESNKEVDEVEELLDVYERTRAELEDANLSLGDTTAALESECGVTLGLQGRLREVEVRLTEKSRENEELTAQLIDLLHAYERKI